MGRLYNLIVKNFKDLWKDSKSGGCLYVFLMLLFLLIIILIETVIGLWLWNVIAVAIFKLPSLTFLQFIGLQMLVGMIFPKNVNVGDN
jgi:hypothetical protein